MRQRLVEQFHTADVVPLPYSNHEFIIRDTNNAIWFSRTDDSENAGTAMLLPGNATIPPTTARWVMPQVLPPEDVLSNLIAGVRAENEATRHEIDSIIASNLVLAAQSSNQTKYIDERFKMINEEILKNKF